MDDHRDPDVVVIGGGLVGSLLSCFLSKNGLTVDVYEMRGDPRDDQSDFTGKSINLAMSQRGRDSLAALGIEDDIIARHGIPMHARLIHDLDGRKRAIHYGQPGQSIYSVSRRFLNQTLLTFAEKNPNVRLFFNHKAISVDFEAGKCDFLVTGRGSSGHQLERKSVKTDVVFGADGAYSSVRKSMMKSVRMNFSQTYIDHGYIELSILPRVTNDGHEEFAMEPNFLHIWPRDEFMMIALPNQDKSFTVTLFMPFDEFEAIKSKSDLMAFFGKYFPDSIDLLRQDNLVRDFFSTSPSSLVSIKCQPLHLMGRGLLVGDAAHAMVPFYGQGMNCGFEDCLVLHELIVQSTSNGCGPIGINAIDFEKVFRKFDEVRSNDVKVICDLAMGNYVEMRHLVNSWSFLFRKHLDHNLNRLFPSRWLSMYQMVSFSRRPYSLCLEERKRQDHLLTRLGIVVGGTAAGLVAYLTAKIYFKT